MLHGQISPGSAEKMFIIVTNSHSATLTDGDWAGWDIATDQDGATVTLVAGSIRSAVAGCFVGSVAAGAVGKIQVWGYHSNAKCKGGSGSLTAKLTEGSRLVMATGNLAIQNMARNATAARAPYGHKTYGVFIAPANTAAKGLSVTTFRGRVMIQCL